MNRGGIKAIHLQRLCHDVDIGFAVTKHNAILHGCHGRLDRGAQHGALGLGIGGGAFQQALCDGRGCLGLACDFHFGRGLQELLGQALDFRRHGGREEQGLAGKGRQLHDALNIRDEAHIQHPVGFVDHQHIDAG